MTNKSFPNRKSNRVKRFDYSSEHAYFITICADKKKNTFKVNEFNEQIIQLIKAYKDKIGFKVYVYCLMPDHLHLLINPANCGKSISSFIGGFKSISTRIAWTYGIKGKLWQGRYYDHILRKNENLFNVGQYILNNPVRKGLVKRWEDYGLCGIIDQY